MKKILYGLGGLVSLLILIGAVGEASTPSQPAVSSSLVQQEVLVSSSPVTSVEPTASPVVKPSVTVQPKPTPTATPKPTATPSQSTTLSNDNYYTNSGGNEVHSPAYSNNIPSGATAICGDGTYSFSQSRRGTCSHHGGVSQWL
jgi:hypothetical protein